MARFEKFDKNRDGALIVVGAGIVAGVVAVTLGVNRLVEYLKEKGDENKKAELDRLRSDLEMIPDPVARLVETGRELADEDIDPEALLAGTVGVNREVMQTLIALVRGGRGSRSRGGDR